MGILGTKTMSGNWSASYSYELLKTMMNKNEIDMIWYVNRDVLPHFFQACW